MVIYQTYLTFMESKESANHTKGGCPLHCHLILYRVSAKGDIPTELSGQKKGQSRFLCNNYHVGTTLKGRTHRE